MKKLLLSGMLALSSLMYDAYGQSYWNPDLNSSSLDAIQFSALDANADGSTWYPTTNKLTFRNVDGQSGYNETRSPIYIADKNNDDWLFTPGILFEAGKSYKIRIEGCKGNFATVDGGVAIMLGSKRTPDAMTSTLLESEKFILGQIGSNSLWNFNVVVTVPITGDYYIGFHATGKPGQKIGIAAIDIAPGIGLSTPAAVENLKLSPAQDGTKKVTLSFKAPSTTKDGNPLTSISKIEIRRGNDLVKTLDNPATGSNQTVEDIVAVSGEYTYKVQAFSESGAGDIAEATTFVGINVPSAATDLKAVNTGTHSARISWNAPQLDKDGYPISANLITYDIYRAPLYNNNPILVAEDVCGLSHEDRIADDNENEQQFYVYYVVAKTSTGNAEKVAADAVPLGKPYDVPYVESFPNGMSTYIFNSATFKGNNYWTRTRNFEDIMSVDNDNGMVYLNGQIGGAATLYSGLINIGTLPSPTLNFYTYNIVPADPGDNRLQVTVYATDGTTKIFDEYTPGMAWNRTIYRLDEFAGKTVRLAFTGFRSNSTELHLDAITISTIYRHDLKLNYIYLPKEVRTSEPFDVTVIVGNNGTEESGEYTVELYCNNEKIAEQSGDKLAAGLVAQKHTFNLVHSILDPDKAVYTAKIVYDKDENKDNNDSDTIEIKVRKNAYPTVADLSGTSDSDGVTLRWSEPDTEKAQPYEITDNFESYPAWANSGLGDWILVDLDKAQIGGFNSQGQIIEMPGIPAYSEQSWWIFDNLNTNFNNGFFSTISGHQFLASMYSGFKSTGEIVQNDDWAISPELFGGPQTISVQARSYSITEDRFEDIELLYSTGSTDPADFISAAKYTNIPNEFQAYTAELPDGAKRFAIRNNNKDRFMLMVDDVTYIPVGEAAAFTINGYNIYRDGKRINDAPVEECEYIDNDVNGDEHIYYVTVLYSAGESQLSNAYTSSATGIESVSADTHAPIEYYNLQGIRIHTPIAGHAYIMRKGDIIKKIYLK